MENKQGGISMNGQPVLSDNAGPVTASNVEPVYYDNGDEKDKLGGKCCGCCCDYRRAVIILNAILIVVSGLSFISTLAIKAEDNFQYNDVDDDAVLDKLNEVRFPLSILTGLGMLFYPVPLVGAIKYNTKCIAFGIVWATTNLIATIIVTYTNHSEADDLTKEDESLSSPIPGFIGPLIGTSLFIYAHAMLINEIKKGIMTEETYEREKHSCCCV